MSQKPMVLYAEDDPDDRELFRDVFLSANPTYDILEVANGREALRYLRSTKGLSHPPALVVLDLNMPVLNGRETLAILKSEKETDKIPVAVFTTSSSSHDVDFCRKFGVPMITKPTSLDEVRTAVNTLVKLAERPQA
jgi:CheY-like chemotaxis protein